MPTADELEVQAAELEHRARLLRDLARRQRQVDAELATIAGPAVKIDLSRHEDTHSLGGMGSPKAPEMPRSHRFHIARAVSKKFLTNPLVQALRERGERGLEPCTISDYARLRGRRPATIVSWIDPSEKNGRSCPRSEAVFAANYFGKDNRDRWKVPPDSTTWPNGIRDDSSDLADPVDRVKNIP